MTLLPVLAQAQDRIVERTYVSTDRQVYVAGDEVWCSAFCIDVTDGGRLSDFSSICYVELVSAEGPVANCKVALENGRGAGHFRLPVSTPTGNYRLCAYTAANRNEVDMDYLQGAPVISVYNTLSNARGEKVILGSKPTSTSEVSVGLESPIRLGSDGKGKVFMENTGSETAELSLSVYCRDGLTAPESCDIHTFADLFSNDRKPRTFSSDRIPEYDGEIITMHVPARFDGYTGFISSPGNKSNIYTSDVQEDGVLTFFTANIYGETNMVFQLNGTDVDAEYDFEVESPFVSPSVSASDIPELYLDDSMGEDLLRRSISMQISDKFGTKILTDYLPERPNLLFSSHKMITYKLEDYTRFQTFEEVFVEYVKEASVRKGSINLIVSDNVYESNRSMFSKNVLAMIDGVPVLDHSLALNMDPNLVDRLELYPHYVAVGSRVYGGVVNFVTLREDMAGVKLPDSSRMLDFNGVCYPIALTGERIDSKYPDYRQTLLWQPLVKLAPGEKIEFNCTLPAYDGVFVIDAVGMTPSGKPLSSSSVL